MIHVTRHAIERAMQRIPGIATEDQAMAILATDRIVIEGGVVVTVLPPDHYRRMVGRIGIPRFGNHSRRKDA